MSEPLKPGEAIVFEGPNIQLIIAPIRDETERRISVNGFHPAENLRFACTLDREEVAMLREFCDVWLGVKE